MPILLLGINVHGICVLLKVDSLCTSLTHKTKPQTRLAAVATACLSQLLVKTQQLSGNTSCITSSSALTHAMSESKSW